MRTYRRLFIPGATYFFTLVTHQRLPLLSDAEAVGRWHSAVRAVQRKMPFAVEGEVVLPDHLHLLWQLPEGDADYPNRLRLVKSAFTRATVAARCSPAIVSASRAAKGEQAVWQRRYWEHTIRDERDFQTHLDYIHINPVRHGLVAAAQDWPYSTFREWVARGVYEPWWGSSDMPPMPDWVDRCDKP